MITNERLTPLADDAGARYGVLLDALGMMFTQASAASNLGSAQSFYDVRFQAHSLANTHMRRERDSLSEALFYIALQGQRDAQDALGIRMTSELSDVASEAVSASYEHVAVELAVQADRDVASLVRSLRQHALSVAIAARAQRIPQATASLQARIGGRGKLEFTVSDRSGTKWPSRRFVRTLWRHALVLIYNDAVLITLAEHGVETARVEHLNPKAEAHGLVIAMSPNTEHPTYAEIRAEVFHPNADAIVVPNLEAA